VTLSRTDDLIIYRDELVGRTDALLRRTADLVLPPGAYALRVGSKFLYDNNSYEIVLLGQRDAICRDSAGATTALPLALVDELFQKELLSTIAPQSVEQPKDIEALMLKEARLKEAMLRLDALTNPEGSKYSERALRRFRAAVRGVTTPQDQLRALMSANEGNRRSRLPAEALRMAEVALKKHNVPSNPTIRSDVSNLYHALRRGRR
jgi:hypothetical protein